MSQIWQIGASLSSPEDAHSNSQNSNSNSNSGEKRESMKQMFECKMNINGRIKTFKDAKGVKDALDGMNMTQFPAIYPCVSILSENTRVWNRFCQADIVYHTREEIGAPIGTKVYCLDGSLLLTEFD